MKEYAIVTERAVEQYQNVGFEAGNVFLIQSRGEQYGQKNFNIILISGPYAGMVLGCQDRFFDFHTVTTEEQKSKRLEAAIKELTECMFEHDFDVRRKLEVLTKTSVNPEDVREELQEYLCKFLDNECNEELERIVEWVEPFEVEA